MPAFAEVTNRPAHAKETGDPPHAQSSARRCNLFMEPESNPCMAIASTRLAAFTLAALLLAASAARAQEKPSDREEIVHILNRITFGPRPGDVEAVEKMGLQAYIQQQLHPESIDDSAVEKELTGFDLLQMSSRQLTELFLSERKKALKKQAELAATAVAKTPATAPATGDATIKPAAPTDAPAAQVPVPEP